MNLVNEMAITCRSCLENRGSISLFTRDDNVCFSDMFFACTSIKVMSGTNSPEMMCEGCLSRLKEAFLFRLQCIRSDAIIKNTGVTVNDTENDFDDRELLDLPVRHTRQPKKRRRAKVKIEKPSETKNGLEELESETGRPKGNVGRRKIKMEVDDNDEVKFTVDLDVTSKNINDRSNQGDRLDDTRLTLKEEISEDFRDYPINVSDQDTNQNLKGQYVCDMCGHCLNGKSELITHFRIHTGEKLFECETCGERFALEGTMHAHARRHGTSNAAAYFVCDVCGAVLSTRDTLRTHRRLHTGELPYDCPECGRAFRALSNLRAHRKTHTGDKRHPCPVCSKMFYTKSDMRDHCRRHTGEQPYSCPLCPRRFTGRANQRLHMKIHTGQRDFPCPQCPKTFVSRDSMVRHGRIHSGERAFECGECNRKFAHRSSLVSHRATHSKTKDFVCDICSQRFGYPSGLYVHKKKKHNLQSTRIIAPKA